jgi:hypothetical protein
MAARDFGPWTYTDELGVHFVRRADKFLTSQQLTDGTPKVGGSTAATLTPYTPIPKNVRPRAAYVSEASTGYRATVVCYSADAPLLGASPPTINVRDAGGTSHTCSVDNQRGERRRVIRRSQ